MTPFNSRARGEDEIEKDNKTHIPEDKIEKDNETHIPKVNHK